MEAKGPDARSPSSNELEYDKAIELYEEILREGAKDADIPAKIAGLKREWKVHNADHGQARQFIYKDWFAKEVSEIKGLLPRRRRSTSKPASRSATA